MVLVLFHIAYDPPMNKKYPATSQILPSISGNLFFIQIFNHNRGFKTKET